MSAIWLDAMQEYWSDKQSGVILSTFADFGDMNEDLWRRVDLAHASRIDRYGPAEINRYEVCDLVDRYGPPEIPFGQSQITAFRLEARGLGVDLVSVEQIRAWVDEPAEVEIPPKPGTAVVARVGETMVSSCLDTFIGWVIGAFMVAVLFIGVEIGFFLGKAFFKVFMFLLLKISYILYVLLT
ncbi:hypothetical protein HD553DRAFT_342232 [Filobasidium floriforme]|uniref:uncharacterized protein n=1 Tax=Filobasidium floriforme TaxID=5210 RepID=UPI001E8ED123|nr:uncharacterized protein HD553DRAFT_342232 [Filobasidium floriforme]KAH8084730.1 hypothetical protein HD553DRAFT_342232 [Filobasidium floriforme]